eukprot:1182650-Prorocentrum_minimum.AAC.1
MRKEPLQKKTTEAYSHDGPIGRRKRGHILTTDQSDAGSTGIFSRRTNRTPGRPRPVKGSTGGQSRRISGETFQGEVEFSGGEKCYKGLNGQRGTYPRAGVPRPQIRRVAVKGYSADAKGYMVDVKGYIVDAKGVRTPVLECPLPGSPGIFASPRGARGRSEIRGCRQTNRGIFSRRTRQAQEAQAYSHDGPVRCRKRGRILTTEHSDAGSAGVFSRRTHQTQDVRVYSHDRPIRRRKRGHILTTDPSDSLAKRPRAFCGRDVIHVRVLRASGLGFRLRCFQGQTLKNRFRAAASAAPKFDGWTVRAIVRTLRATRWTVRATWWTVRAVVRTRRRASSPWRRTFRG